MRHQSLTYCGRVVLDSADTYVELASSLDRETGTSNTGHLNGKLQNVSEYLE